MDQDKLLAPCVGRDGVTRPVIEQVLVNLPPSIAKRWLVTSADRPEVIRLAQAYGCEVLLLHSAGMGDSIAAAVAASASGAGWLVVLGDMPFVLPSSIEQVVAELERDRISVPVHQGQYGHPVGFGGSFGPGLMALTGDRGAKPLFAQALVREVLVDDPGVLWDVDVPDSLYYR
ncbi:NTP transferase domain-containing protein [Pseudomonas sp. CCM 7891]|uniref:NTP transferase domain-containing protein n=2 Tax=Pseudomonas karstica TaxID=1055468 RepID=A0A7X2RXF1_9PSED|nr:NTP transferase domain-containing protein [Pseudomonas karstica]